MSAQSAGTIRSFSLPLVTRVPRAHLVTRVSGFETRFRGDRGPALHLG